MTLYTFMELCRHWDKIFRRGRVIREVDRVRRKGQEGKNINIKLVGSALLDLLVGGTRTYLISLMIYWLSFYFFFSFSHLLTFLVAFLTAVSIVQGVMYWNIWHISPKDTHSWYVLGLKRGPSKMNIKKIKGKEYLHTNLRNANGHMKSWIKGVLRAKIALLICACY